ncbi:SPOR domain-containing protein [Mesobacterium pallidum]|uniref:SPOR domain-containing protein n=1 Tax=Mesobacterium pallidum TaxID=2872037 RepID=UPI001EE1D0E6|nr:SPOR domain-containing protein [Mesobacterium pallidum]
MADFPMGSTGQAGHYGYSDTEEPAAPLGARVGTMANWAGAVVSLALIAGVGVWGYKLLMRDVTGIPVVRAAEGPMRIAPKDPGGRRAEHQGLAVNSVAGSGAAEPPADRLVLAPQGIGLTDEDQPLRPAALLPAPAPEAPTVQDAPVIAQTGAEAGEPGVMNEVQRASLLALADQIAAANAPLSPLAPASQSATVEAPMPEAESDTAADTTEAPNDDPLARAVAEAVASDVVAEVVLPREGLWKSPRPSKRPAGLQTASLGPVTVAPEAAAGPRELDLADIPVGTRLAQLGAFDSPETAREEWDRLVQKFDVYMEGKDRVIEKASSGGRTFYRLRAHGFDDLADARRFCSAFVAERADCIPVVKK